ncbi:MAG: dienelactone hydrolase family protein [Acidimicrobiia bacterium]
MPPTTPIDFETPTPGMDPFHAQVGDLGIAYDVYSGGDGPGVILMHEIDGFKDHVEALANHLVGEGFTVYVPKFFSGFWAGLLKCVRREFICVLGQRTSPISYWVGELAAVARQRDPEHRNVGVIGMCFSGGFALASLVTPGPVKAAVAAQPAMPWAGPAWMFTRSRELDLGLDPVDLTTLKEELVAGTSRALPLRFEKDWICPRVRVDAIAEMDGAEPLHLVSGGGHPTLTKHFREGGDEDSLAAISETASFLHDALDAPSNVD